MDSPLRKVRVARGMTLDDVRDAIKKNGGSVTGGHLSIIERGCSWPSKEMVSALIEVFEGEITEMQILYPFKDSEDES